MIFQTVTIISTDNTGKLTVFDFENCPTCFYLFNLANLWTHGVGWITHKSEVDKRKAFMDEYFKTVLDSYRSETDLTDDKSSRLPLMIQTVMMENIIDELEVQKLKRVNLRTMENKPIV